VDSLLTRSFQAVLEQEFDTIWGRHFAVPAEVARDFKSKEIRRITCGVNNTQAFHAALMPQGLGQTMILMSKERCKISGFLPGDLLDVTLVEDRSKYGMEMPEELVFILQENPDVYELFEALTPGKKRNLIHTVNSVKSPDIRIRKALVVSEHLLIHGGKIDFKALNEEMKAANNRGRIN